MSTSPGTWSRGRLFFCCLMALLAMAVDAWAYTNLSIAVYFRYQEVHSIPTDLNRFSNQWVNVEKQVKVDKVYLETTRNTQLATESDVTTLNRFFAARGIKTSAGLGLTANEPKGFQSYCYSTPADRQKVKSMTEFTARHFDEIILDDFFFSILPQIRGFENDNRLTINFNTALSGYPMAITCAYGQGTFSVLAVPDDFADLYRLPRNVLN